MPPPAGNLRPVDACEEAICQHGVTGAEFHRDTDVTIIQMRLIPCSIHLPLAVPPRSSGRLFSFLAAATLLLCACASGPPKLPYPAFVQTDELEDVFMAALPGIRAKQLAGDPQMRTTSNRVDLPPDWQGTSGASPGKALEIFVLSGRLMVADIALDAGGYAYLPSGSLGFNLASPDGARILYFLDNVDPLSVIRTPIIIDSNLLDWQASPTNGMTTMELRADPGSGARTWLVRIEPGAELPWESSTALREGFLIKGIYRHSECDDGQPQTGDYMPGGYFYRPGDVVNGGPDSNATEETIWLLREKIASKTTIHASCA